MSVFGKQQVYQQDDMELMNILYLQDIDIGVVRDNFNGSYQAELDTGPFPHEAKSMSCIQENKDAVDKQSIFHYIVDGETGELVPVTLNSTELSQTTEHQSLATAENLLLDSSPQVPHVDYSRQTSFDERLLDVYDILGLPTSTEEPSLDSIHNQYQQYSVSDNVIAATFDDGQQYITDSSPTGQCMDVLVDELDSFHQFSGRGSAESNVCFDSNRILETHQFVNGASARNSSSVMVPPLLIPPLSSNGPELEPDISDFFNSGGLDNEAMSLFIQSDSSLNDFIPVSTSPASFKHEQPNISLTNPLQYDFAMVQDSGCMMENDNLTYSASFSAASVNVLGDVHSMVAPIVEQPSVVEPTEEDNTDLLLQQVLLNDLADPLDLYVCTGYNMAGSDCSSDSAISSMASQNDQVDGFQPALLNPAMGAQGWVNTFPTGSMASDVNIYDEAAVLTHKPQYSLDSSSFSEDAMELSPVESTKNVQQSRTASKLARKSHEKIVQEVIERDKNQESNRSRDAKRAKALKVPLTMDEIIDSSVEEFTELMNQYQLTDAQQQLIRDIRRRGKNKMAAQNCRKRKMEVIGTLEEQVMSLRDQCDMLRQQRGDLDKKFVSLQDRFRQLESQLFQHVRDKSGRLYDRNHYSILQTDDGGLFIIPRANSAQQQQQSLSADGAARNEKSGRKRKAKDMN